MRVGGRVRQRLGEDLLADDNVEARGLAEEIGDHRLELDMLDRDTWAALRRAIDQRAPFNARSNRRHVGLPVTCECKCALDSELARAGGERTHDREPRP